jgi:hypothetical protein
MSKEWLAYEKWGQCSGKFGIFGHAIKDGLVMGNGCRGKSIGAFIIDEDADDDDHDDDNVDRDDDDDDDHDDDDDDDDDDYKKSGPKPVLTVA